MNRQSLMRKFRKVFLFEFVEAIVAAIIIAALLRFLVVSAYRVPTESMMPTLIPGDVVIAWKTSYGIQWPWSDQRVGARDPDRGDIVIFRHAEEDAIFVKRVIGRPGDRIEIRDGVVSLNEVPTSISRRIEGGWEYSEETTGASTHRVMVRASATEPDFLAPMVVPPGHVFVMGDLRSESLDSRHWGPIPIDQIVGRVSFIAFSLEVDGFDPENPQGLTRKAEFTPRANLRFDRLLRALD